MSAVRTAATKLGHRTLRSIALDKGSTPSGFITPATLPERPVQGDDSVPLPPAPPPVVVHRPFR